jgi:hypothetical protein
VRRAIALLVFGFVHASLARADEPVVTHVFALPNDQQLSTDLAPITAQAGEPPGAGHARGTIFVVEAEAGRAHVSIAEWDLASGTRIRSAYLPVPPTNRILRFVRAGGRFHFVTSPTADAQVSYIRLASDLHVEEVSALGLGENAFIATDGSLVAIEWSETIDPDSLHHAFHLLTVDGAGKRIASSVILRSAPHQILDMFKTSLAVIGGKIFAFAWDPAQPLTTPRTLLWRLNANGQVEVERPLPEIPESGSLVPAGGRLLMVSAFCFATLWNTDLVEIGTFKNPPHRDPYGYFRCPPFGVDADAGGRLLTTYGEVLSPELHMQSQFVEVPRELRLARPLWVGTEPTMVEAGPTGRASIVWGEALSSGPP